MALRDPHEEYQRAKCEAVTPANVGRWRRDVAGQVSVRGMAELHRTASRLSHAMMIRYLASEYILGAEAEDHDTAVAYLEYAEKIEEVSRAFIERQETIRNKESPSSRRA